jgi:DNA-binding NarL/FixJ family response regulator
MTRILLIDDQEVVRIGLKKLLAEAFPTVECTEATSSQEALKLATQAEWDLIILELSFERNNGLELLKDIKRNHPKVPALILTGHSEQQYALRSLKAGAAGFVTKTSHAVELVKAVKKVAQGGRYVSTSLAETLSADLNRKTPDSIHEMLSDREFQVMRLMGSGKTVGQIATLLSISDKTVSTYRARILEKTRLKNNAELVRYVVENGLID